MAEETTCPVCQGKATTTSGFTSYATFYHCPICGIFEIFDNNGPFLQNNMLAPFLYYNRINSPIFQLHSTAEHRYYTTLSKEDCAKFESDYQKGNHTRGRPIHMDPEVLSNWFPKTFAKRIDMILLKLDQRTSHIGQTIYLYAPEVISLLFIDRYTYRHHYGYAPPTWSPQDSDEISSQCSYMMDYLKGAGYITSDSKLIMETDGNLKEGSFQLTPAAYARIDALQKYNTNSRKAFVAMVYKDTEYLRAKIKAGITEAGYENPDIMDEIPHNDYIVPEMLKHIRDCRFMVADLSVANPGVYFEVGYATALGKPVIQLCKKGSEIHFDLVQRNTLIYENEDKIPELLANRIKATIE